jgi:uncharacterized protein YhfF
MRSDTVEQFWHRFCSGKASVDAGTPYQVWHFGNTQEMAGELVGLVLSGRKTATASSLMMNEREPENAPRPDGYSVVTDFDGEPVCVIQTAEIRHVQFDEVDARFAAEEGEGDLSLEYWRRVHRDYFTAEAARYGFKFDERSIICCERFRLLFPR